MMQCKTFLQIGAMTKLCECTPYPSITPALMIQHEGVTQRMSRKGSQTGNASGC